MTFESRSDQDGARSSTRAQYEEMKQRAGATCQSEVRHPLWKQSDLVERLHQPAQFVSQAAAQIVDKTEHKAMERVKAQAGLKRLKEVKLKGTTEVEQSPYDKLPFPQRVLTKAQKNVISKFRKDMSAVGVKLPEISHMHDAHVQMMLIRDILAHKEEVAELLDISTM
ncbi:hypothetical protein F2Q69_00024433 [Brassica cretica]|uniref:Uncharacterized protein n=1 Tax=Brassica cretica TaxID=69181 RepID=A0A8S9QCG2_BRACR|nr:hypothetical protein F2Q69_00024433 [Brassica cretica]